MARGRIALFLLGILTSYVALASPLDVGGDHYLFSLHMVQHILLMMVAPPLWLMGIAGMRAPSGLAWKVWQKITRPWLALTIFTAVMLFWHIPQLYDSALRVEALHVIEHITFTLAGAIFWWPIVAPGGKAVSPLTKIAFLAVSGIAPTALGFLFVMATVTFYPYYEFVPRLWGVSVLTDQQLAGVAMLGLGNLIYFIPISAIFWRLLEGAEDDHPVRSPDPVA
jgi:putative membrane protein